MILAGPLVLGVFVLMGVRARQDGRPLATLLRDVLVTGAAALIIINAAYPVHSRALAEWEIRAIHALFADRAPFVLGGLDFLAYPLPTDFVMGILYQYVHNQFGHAASLLGMHSQHGWRYYFAVAFALKVPVPVLVLSLAALAWSTYRAIRFRDARHILLVAGFAVYFVYCSLSKIQIGVRYLLPAYPLLFIMIGAMLDALMRASRRRLAAVATTVVALLWMAADAVRAYPDYMTYMSPLAARQPPYRYLSDANVEWGDDVRGLAMFLRERGETKVQGAFVNHALLPFYGVEFVDLLTPAAVELPRTNYVALGAAYLNGTGVAPAPILGRTLSAQQRIDYFDSYRTRTPERIIGGSIYVFRNDR